MENSPNLTSTFDAQLYQKYVSGINLFRFPVPYFKRLRASELDDSLKDMQIHYVDSSRFVLGAAQHKTISDSNPYLASLVRRFFGAF